MFSLDQVLVRGYGWIAPIPAWRAGADARARALRPFESAPVLESLRRDADRRVLLILYQAATGLDLWAPGEARETSLIAAVEAALAGGQLLLLPGGEAGAASGRQAGKNAQDGGIDAAIDVVMAGRRTLTFQNRRYFFTSAERWSGPESARDYVPMRVQAARDLVAGMEASLARTPADHAAWQALAGALTDPRSGPGILLLGQRPASSPNPRGQKPPVTPSQLAPKIADQDWIELQLQWDDGTPFDGDFLLTMPGGRTTEGPPDAGGVVRVDSVDSGDCKLTFPDLFPDSGA